MEEYRRYNFDKYFEDKNVVPQICTEKIIGMGAIKEKEKDDAQNNVVETTTGVIIAPSTGVAPHQAIGGGMIFAAIILAALTIIFSKTKKDEVEE